MAFAELKPGGSWKLPPAPIKDSCILSVNAIVETHGSLSYNSWSGVLPEAVFLNSGPYAPASWPFAQGATLGKWPLGHLPKGGTLGKWPLGHLPMVTS